MPRSLQWPPRPYLTAQLSEMPEMVVMMKSGREGGHLREVGSIFECFLPRGAEATPTRSSRSQDQKPETWDHISLKIAGKCAVFLAVCLENKADSSIAIVPCAYTNSTSGQNKSDMTFFLRFRITRWTNATFSQIPLLPFPFHRLWQDVKTKKKTPTLKCYLLLFLARSFYQDAAAAAERKINVAAKDEADDITKEQKRGRGEEWTKMSHQPAIGQPTQTSTKWPWEAGWLHCLSSAGRLFLNSDVKQKNKRVLWQHLSCHHRCMCFKKSSYKFLNK